MATCRSCGAVIRWAETVNKKRMPIEPADGGNLKLDGKTVLFVQKGTGTHQSHFVSCPNAATHRKAS